MISLSGIEYLSSLRGKVPNTTMGIGFDGQRLGVVCYSLVDDGSEKMANGDYRKKHKAIVWYAEAFDGVGMSGVYDLGAQVADLATGTSPQDVQFVIRGDRKKTLAFVKEARRLHGIKITEFEKKAYGWDEGEIITTVLDDIQTGRIAPAPEFQNRPEYQILNASLRSVRLGSQIDVLAEAALYGFGMFSAYRSRPKYYVGGLKNFQTY